MNLSYHTARGALGQMLLAEGEQGTCAVLWVRRGSSPEEELRCLFPAATLRRQQALATRLEVLLRASEGLCAIPQDWHLDLGGSTSFQRRVWHSVQAIRPGQTKSYGALAAALGGRGHARATGGACAANRLALLIPCHRVVCANGSPGNWRWGTWRKQALLESEQGMVP